MTPITHVLGLDQAARTGWAVKPVSRNRFTSLPFLDHGYARCGRFDECAAVARRAMDAAGDPRALLVMFEDHSKMPLTRGTRFDPRSGKKPFRGTPQILGIGAARGYWWAVLDAAGHPTNRRDKVEPHVWRGRVTGVTQGDADRLKAAAVLAAGGRVRGLLSGHDEAEAICIAEWAACDGVLRFEHTAAQRRAKGRAEPTVEQLEIFASERKV